MSLHFLHHVRISMSRPSIGAAHQSAHIRGHASCNGSESHNFARLARVLLCLGTMPLLSSCIIPPREYPPEPPGEGRAPWILNSSVNPELGATATICLGVSNTLQARFQYERANDSRDQLISPELTIYSRAEPPADPDPVILAESDNLQFVPPRAEIGLDFETINTITIPWKPDADMKPRDYQLRLVLSHHGNFGPGIGPLDDNLADDVTWHIDVLALGDPECPRQ